MNKKLVIIFSNRRQAKHLLKWIEDNTSIKWSSYANPTAKNPFHIREDGRGGRIIILKQREDTNRIKMVTNLLHPIGSPIDMIEKGYYLHKIVNVRDGMGKVKASITNYITLNTTQ
jgi:hypothetical protein